MVFAKVGDRKFGHIKNGKFVRKFATDAEESAVMTCCENPEKAAICLRQGLVELRDLPQDVDQRWRHRAGIGPVCLQAWLVNKQATGERKCSSFF